MTNDEIAIKIQAMHRAVRRSPWMLKNDLDLFKKSGYMQAQHAIDIIDIYGVTPYFVFLLCYSHGIFVDMEGILYDLERRKEKTSVQCDEK